MSTEQSEIQTSISRLQSYSSFKIHSKQSGMSKPWDSIQLNVKSILQSWKQHKISTSGKINYLFNPQKLKKVKFIEDVAYYYKTCINISSSWEYPHGIPHINTSNLMESYNSDLDQLCFIHTPGFLDHKQLFIIANTLEYYDIHWMFMPKEQMFFDKCYKKTRKHYLCNINNCNLDPDSDIINIAIPLLEPQAFHSVTHFRLYIYLGWSVIYELISNLNDDYFYNISLITHLVGITSKDEPERITFKAYFWRKFGLSWTETNVFNEYINITFIPYNHYKMRKCPIKNVFYSPFMIQYYFIRFRDKYDGIDPDKEIVSLTHRRQYRATPRNAMYAIKPVLSNLNVYRNIVLYLDRGGTGNVRGIDNNVEVIKSLRLFIKQNQNQNQLRYNYEFQVFNHADYSSKRGAFKKEENLFSKCAIIIGPHGGAFSNINAVQPGTFILEFIDFWTDQRETNKQHVRSTYFAASQANGLNYYYLKPKYFDFNEGSMYIEINTLLQMMKQIYDKIEDGGKVLSFFNN